MHIHNTLLFLSKHTNMSQSITNVSYASLCNSNPNYQLSLLRSAVIEIR